MNNSPYHVTAHGGRAHFFVGNFVPRTMVIAAQNATQKVVIRLAGGMNNLPEEIFPFFRVALQGIDGAVLMSGGTRAFGDDNEVLASVCEVVADLGQSMSNLITMGSFPRTGRFGLVGDGRFMVGNGDKATINVGTDYICAIQSGPEDTDSLVWDGDVPAYITFMCGLRDEMGFSPAVIVRNGGGVTVKEVKKAHEAGIPIFVVTGTGRAADNQLSSENFSGDGIVHVHKTLPEVLQVILQANGLSR